MSLLTLPLVPRKDAFQTFELNTLDLIDLASDPYFKDTPACLILTPRSVLNFSFTLSSYPARR
jgi:hypothetical protein